MEIGEILVRLFQLRNFLRGNGAEGTVEVVDGLDEVFGEVSDGEIFGGLDVAFRAVLEVAEVGDGAEVLVLLRGMVS